MTRLRIDQRFSGAVRRVGEMHVAAASGYVLHAALSREGVADCALGSAACYITNEREPKRVLLVHPIPPERRYLTPRRSNVLVRSARNDPAPASNRRS